MPFHVAPNNPIIRGLYINDFIDPAKPVILGNAVREAQVLQFCVNHQINYIALYDLDRGLFNWSSSASTLRSFITKARTSGITQVAAALSSSSGAVNRLRTYNNACANNNQRFDYLTIEHEWWNGDLTHAAFVSNLEYMYPTLSGMTPPVKVDLYMGWPLTDEMEPIVPLLDRVSIHSYVVGAPSYNYTRHSNGKDRLLEIANHCAAINKQMDVVVIFSSEPNFSGPWFETHTLYDGYYAWAVPSTSTSNGSYNNESNSNIRNYINPTGYMMFDWTLIRDIDPPAPPPITGSTGFTGCTTTINADGPTTFVSGDSVNLTVVGQGVVSGVTTVPQFNKILLVWGENESRTFVNNINCPWIASIASAGADMTGAKGTSHPSQPNYLQLISGSNQGVTDNNPVPGTPLSSQNLFGELISIGKDAVSYSEDLPSAGSLVSSSGDYARRHNPVTNWQSNTPTGWQVAASKNQPFTTFAAISDYNTLPDFSWIIPNNTNNGHDISDNNLAAQAYDTWLQANLDDYKTFCSNPANNSLLIVAFDESEQSDPANPIRTVIYGAHVQPGVYNQSINHYNILRTIEDGLGLDAFNLHAGAAAAASPIINIFTGITTGQSATYSWSPGGQTTSTINVTQSGSYSCTATNYSGCVSTSNIIQVNVLSPAYSAFTASIITSGSSYNFQTPGSITLSAVTNPISATTIGTGYVWSDGQSTESIRLTGSGCYSCTVWFGGFSARTSTVCVQGFTGNTGYTVSLVPTGTTFSAQFPSGVYFSAITSPSSAATTYSWSNGSITSGITASTSGTYYVDVSDVDGNIVTSYPVNVQIFTGSSGFNTFVIPSGPTSFFSGGSVQLCALSTPTSAATSGGTYLWSNSATTRCITATTTGSYNVIITDSFNNSVTSNSIFVNAVYFPFTASIVADGPLTFTIPNDVELTAVTNPINAGSSYLWSNGETTQAITSTTTGYYYCTVTDTNGTTAQTNTVYVNAQYVPLSANYTETIIDSSWYALNNNAYVANVWTPIYIHLSASTADTYYAFVKIKTTGEPTAMRVSLDGQFYEGGTNFVPSPMINHTDFRWYRLGAFNNPIKQILGATPSILNFQGVNKDCDMEYCAFSTNPDFIPGPYPATTP